MPVDAPARRRDTLFIDAGLRPQKFEGCLQVRLGAGFGNSADEFARHGWRGCHSAAIKRNRGASWPRSASFSPLFFHPFVFDPVVQALFSWMTIGAGNRTLSGGA